MRHILLLIITLAACVTGTRAANPKREFRGAWIQTVFQDSYLKRTTAENKAYLREQLDKLAAAGVNAVIFQVRPQSDAFYRSEYEPWSRWLSPEGKAPRPAWDPLQFMIDEAHARGMELHAWLNPYRATTGRNQTLPAGHMYHKHPEWFVRFDGKLYYDPGRPECRSYIVNIVSDIVSRYDVDGIHFDDYFYPYPVKGVKFADATTFKKYGKGKSLADWRRSNVDNLIRDVHQAIAGIKPWVVFGVSPFGIWRNKTTDPAGSDTRGLQNYDDLYADVLLWARNGWIDYQLPQIYWNTDHASASYLTLIDWWKDHAEGRHLFVGQDVARTMGAERATERDGGQLYTKVDLTRRAESIQGNCWWPAAEITSNKGGIADILARDLQSNIALTPSYPWISEGKPLPVSNLHFRGGRLMWTSPRAKGTADDAVKFVVYRFDSADKVDLSDAGAIIGVTRDTKFDITAGGYYVVTSLSRVNTESDDYSAIKIRL